MDNKLNCPIEPVFLTPAQAARAINVSRSQAYVLIRSGALPSVRIGCVNRVPVEAIRRLARKAEEAGELKKG